MPASPIVVPATCDGCGRKVRLDDAGLIGNRECGALLDEGQLCQGYLVMDGYVITPARRAP